MEKEIPTPLIETLLTLGMEDKEHIKTNFELIESLKNFNKYGSECNPEAWQAICGELSRESHIILLKGLVYADILAWGPSTSTIVNVVFSKLNTRCWPDTVFSVIRWALNVCEYHKFATGSYAFSSMLENR